MVKRYGWDRETCQAFGSISHSIAWIIKRLWSWIYRMRAKDSAGSGIKQEFKVTEYSAFIPLSVKVTVLILTLN